MYLKKLSLQNLKGPAGDYELTPATVITGPNFSGKTRIMQGAQLALLGYVPGLKKTAQALQRLMSGNPMSVFAQVGSPVLSEKTEGAVERHYTVTAGKLTTKTNQHGLKDIDLVNPTSSAIAVLDAEKFVGAGESDRIRMIWELVNIASKDQDPDKLVNELLVKEELNKGVPRGTMGFQEWLGKAIEYAKSALKGAKQAVDRMASTAQGMVVLDKGDAGAIPEEIEVEISGLETDRKDPQARLAALKASVPDAAPVQQRVKRAKDALEAKRRALAAIPEPSEINNELAEDRKSLAALEAMGPVTTSQEALKRFREIDAVADEKKEQSGEAARKSNAQNEKVRQLTAQAAVTTCDHCGAKLSKAKVDKIKEALEAAQQEAGPLNDAVTAAMKAHEEAEQNAARAKDNCDTMENIERIRRSIEQGEGQLAQHDSLVADIDLLEQDLKQAESEMPNTDDAKVQEEYQIEQEIEEIDSKITDAKTRLRTAQQAAQNRALAAQAALRGQQDEAAVVNWKKAVEVLEVARDNMIECAFTELIQFAEPVLRDLLETPLDYHEGELGRWERPNQQGRFIHLETFSGAETILVTIGLQAALGSQAPVRIAMIDELGRVDAKRKIKLMQNLAGMIKAGDLDQFIGIDVDATAYRKVKDLTLIEVQ